MSKSIKVDVVFTERFGFWNIVLTEADSDNQVGFQIVSMYINPNPADTGCGLDFRSDQDKQDYESLPKRVRNMICFQLNTKHITMCNDTSAYPLRSIPVMELPYGHTACSHGLSRNSLRRDRVIHKWARAGEFSAIRAGNDN